MSELVLPGAVQSLEMAEQNHSHHVEEHSVVIGGNWFWMIKFYLIN